MGLVISPTLEVPDEAISIRFVRSGGPGGQNVNKVATSAQLRFDVAACPGLNYDTRMRLKTLAGRRLTDDNILVISAQRFRTQEQNRRDAYERLTELLQKALVAPKPRKATRPTRASKERRLEGKEQRGTVKKLRGKVGRDD
jgi:ribosome-associated protein